MEYRINAIWDGDARVWIASSDDIPGLTLESGSLDALIERVRTAVPELLHLNGGEAEPVPLFFTSERHDWVAV
ncbi:MAG TPA: DUF1902 domain-containing protein [Synergistaceae bacterium]|nr:DUF1902 domain-containing protein [Spirochaetales bacterium]HPR90581.1 DUF1902 domain-containing protein [Synergistaceae bacterium]